MSAFQSREHDYDRAFDRLRRIVHFDSVTKRAER
jgi:hypothetical protein